MRANNSILLKTISAVLFLSLSIATVSIYLNPITGYEFSLYSSMPTFIWLILITAIVSGIVICIQSCVKGGRWWQIGLLLILVSNLVIVLLPYLKGYAFSCNGDQLSHLGFVKDILSSGSIGGNVYPITHVWFAQLCSILNINPDILINYYGPLFYLAFVFITYLLSKELISKPGAILATIASTVLLSYYYNQVFPMGFAFITFPLAFYLYFKNLKTRSTSISLLLILLIITLVFFHPVTSAVFTFALVVFELSKILITRFDKNRTPALNPGISGEVSLGFPILSIVALLLWVWNNYSVWDNSVFSVASWFRSEILTEPMTQRALEAFSKLNLSLLEQATLFLKLYGTHVLYLFMSLFAIVIFLRRRGGDISKNNNALKSYALFSVCAIAVWMLDYYRPLTSLSSGRLICVVVALFPLLVGFVLSKLGGMEIKTNGAYTSRPSKNIIRTTVRGFIVGTTITVCSLIGLLAFYPSPYIYQPYWGVTNATFDGGVWLVAKGNSQTAVLQISAPNTGRIANALAWKGAYPASAVTAIPSHFGYDLNQTLGQYFVQDSYLFLVDSDEYLYTELWPQVGRYSIEDFVQLRHDSTINQIYNNGEATSYYVYAR